MSSWMSDFIPSSMSICRMSSWLALLRRIALITSASWFMPSRHTAKSLTGGGLLRTTAAGSGTSGQNSFASWVSSRSSGMKSSWLRWISHALRLEYGRHSWLRPISHGVTISYGLRSPFVITGSAWLTSVQCFAWDDGANQPVVRLEKCLSAPCTKASRRHVIKDAFQLLVSALERLRSQ